MTDPSFVPAACDLCHGSWEQIGCEMGPGASRGARSEQSLYPLLRCTSCRSLRLGVPPEHMGAYLAASHYNDPAMDAAAWDARRGVLTWIADRFLADLPSSSTTLVDFGASFGHLGRVLQGRHYAVIGVEPNARARMTAAARRPALRMVADLGALAAEAGTIDAIVAIDSLYYTDAPRTVLHNMANLLRHGGRLVMRNTDGGFRWMAHRLLGNRSSGGVLGDACWGFTTAGVTTAIRAAGLEMTGVHYLERGRGAGVRGLYDLLSGLVATASRGRLPVSPGWVMTAVKPAR